MADELSNLSSGRYWRNLGELSDAAGYQREALDEFAPGAMDPPQGVSRRNLLKVMGASAALAGLGISGCKRKTDETIVPYVSQPEEVVPGKPLYFATAMTLGGYAQGVMATSHEGRPTKLEGNPDHSASLGAADIFVQASLLGLYDPDRAQTVTRVGSISDWDAFIGEIRPRLADKTRDGSGLAILTETVTSPTLIDQIGALKKKYPGARWFGHDPVGRYNVRAGLREATGKELLPRYDFSRARVVVSLDCDFLAEEPGHLRYARDFVDGRRIRAGTADMNRLYVIESTYTITGTMADHRWAMRPSQIHAAAEALAGAISNRTAAPAWVSAVALDLLAHRGQCLVVAGAQHPPQVHRIVHSINEALGNSGSTVIYTPPVEADPDGFLAELAEEMDRGSIDFLLILGGNPVYSSPGDLKFGDRLENFSSRRNADGSWRNLTARLGLYDDETSLKCQWHLPQTHFLEDWGDAAGFDGSIATMQPLIERLYAGRSAVEAMHILRETTLVDGYEIVREFWQRQLGGGDFEATWSRWVERGTADLPADFHAPPPGTTKSAPLEDQIEPAGDAFEISIRPDPCVWDGSFSNLGWLQELPKPLTKLTWDNAALISQNSAAKLNVINGDMLRIATPSGAVEFAALILPGQPDQTITIHLGYGRTRAGSVGTDVGFDAYPLRVRGRCWFTTAQVKPTGQKHELVTTHAHQTMAQRRLPGPDPLEADVTAGPGDENLDNRKLIRVATLRQYMDDPQFAKKLDEDTEKHPLTLYPGFDNIYKQNLAWAMSIDTQSCIGCNACVIACQAENNSPVVGKDQVSRGREMHWIRIDTYFHGDAEAPSGAYHQPVPCMQCENAPCELVCPVGATVHDNEGLNDMVYNRCVGTRYCSNNCPYKVRRFNFLSYADYTTESLKLMRNPQVTVRSRGVMEKCTYCIQRITATRIEMEKLQVDLDEQARSAEPAAADALHRKSAMLRQQMLDSLQTACQQACPTEAIVFGNINMAMEPIRPFEPDHRSRVKTLKDQPLDYSLLADLVTRPRTTYLARIVNPNTALPASAGAETPS